jgi:phage-related protein
VRLGARREFGTFPATVQRRMLRALTVAAEGAKDDLAKPFKGVQGGVFEIAMRHAGNAFRSIYVVRIDSDLWVVDAFQKKSKAGVMTPKMDVDLIRERIQRLKEALR